jgi:hypothetical protein
MPDAGAFNIGGTYAGTWAGGTADASARADVSAAADAQRRAALEAARIGDQRAHQKAMAALLASRDLVPAADYEEGDDAEDHIPEEEQTEIDMSDEDSPRMDGWDDEPYDRPENPVKPSGNQDDDSEAVENLEPFRIIVDGDSCWFERPDWWNCKARTTPGRSFLADSERKFRMMSAIAAWLSNNRKDFLRDPDPWHLGVSALQEFKQGCASVKQRDFLEYAKLSSFAGPDLFSRNIRKTDLVFDDGQVPLGFLFEDDARMAWVARVVKDLPRKKSVNMTQVLANFADVTVPKGEREGLLSRDLAALDFGGLIARACAMAGGNQPVSWSETIKRYKKNLL